MRVLFIFIVFAAAVPLVAGQSVEQQFPTPVRTGEIFGSINARPIGDGRLTTYYYTFTGDQGDLFLNLVTTNLNADIDLFVEQGLRPLSKIVVYADRGETETGRVVYLRKPEKLLLRIQGRTPNDDPGRFRLKFAGSFVAAASDLEEAPDRPRVPIAETRTAGDAEVESARRQREIDRNSRPDEVPTETVKAEDAQASDADEDDEEKRSEVAQVPEIAAATEEVRTADQPESALEVPKDESRSHPELARFPPPEKAESKRTDVVVTDTTLPAKPDPSRTKTRPRLADPMAMFTLVVSFRDGTRLEMPMLEVSRFLVVDGVLTILRKNGTPTRYSMADVMKVSIE